MIGGSIVKSNIFRFCQKVVFSWDMEATLFLNPLCLCVAGWLAGKSCKGKIFQTQFSFEWEIIF